MKRLIFFVSILLSLCSEEMTLSTAYGVGTPGLPNGSWPQPVWGQPGFRPMPVMGGYPAYSYPYSYPAYPPYFYSQPGYPYPPPQSYSSIPQNFAANPFARTALPPAYPYAMPRGQQFYRAPVAARTTTATALATAADQSKFAEQERRIHQLSNEVTRIRAERDQALSELSAWTSLGISIDQIRALQQQLAKFQADNTFLVHENSALRFQLGRYFGPEMEVKMPTDLKGKVLTVDPKFQFVVLNIGDGQGVAKEGKLLVSRNGKLVGKLRVTRVQANTSVANILSDWKLADVMEGDQVIHQ
jgi:hypothetical protein